MHDSADAAGGADDAMVGKLVFDSAVTIATAIMLKNGLDFPANFLVRRLHGSGCRGVVVAASRNVKDGTNPPDAVACGLVNVADHFSEFGWVRAPRIIAVFFKMSFSALSRALSLIDQVAADAECFGNLSNRLPCADKFDGLGFELRTITLTGFIIPIGFL